MEIYTDAAQVKSLSWFQQGDYPIAVTPPLVLPDEVYIGLYCELSRSSVIRVPVSEFDELKSFLYDPLGFRLVTHGIKRIWEEHGIGRVETFTDFIADTEILAYLLDSSKSEAECSLSSLAWTYRNFRYSNRSLELDNNDILEILRDDAILIYDLGVILLDEMDDDLRWLFFFVELRVALILNEMSRYGLPVDGPASSLLYRETLERAEALETSLLGGRELKLWSAADVYRLLRADDPKELTQAQHRRREVSSKELKYLSGETAAAILEWRDLQPELGFLRAAAGQDRVHPRWDFWTKTARIVASQPAVQSVSRELRHRLMVPPSGWVLVKADYKQFQMRILANLSNDPELVSAFRQGLDVHWLTVEMCDIQGATDKERRDKAKTVNFGILFQMTAWGLSQDLETDVATAQRYIRAFWKKYSVAKDYLDRFVQELRAKPPEERWIKSDSGRIRRFSGPFGKAEARSAKATLLQHNEADILRLAVMRLYARFRDLKMQSRIVMLIHDAVYVEAPQVEAKKAKEVLKREMEGAMEMPLVPLEVDVD